MEMSEEKKTKRIEIKTKGEDLLKKVKEVLHEGNVRRLIIRDGAGKTLLEVPVTVGVVGILLAPSLAAIGVIAALVTDCSIVVEKE
jgi:hypothetical protein